MTYIILVNCSARQGFNREVIQPDSNFWASRVVTLGAFGGILWRCVLYVCVNNSMSRFKRLLVVLHIFGLFGLSASKKRVCTQPLGDIV